MSNSKINFTKLYEKSLHDSDILNRAADEGITQFKKKLSSDMAKNTVKDSYNVASLDDGSFECQRFMSIVDKKLKENNITNYKIDKHYSIRDQCYILINPIKPKKFIQKN